MRIGNRNAVDYLSLAVFGPDETAPVMYLAEVGNVAANVIALWYNEPLDESSEPAAGDYSVSGTTETVSSISISGRIVYVTMSGDITYEDTILISYTAGTNPVRDIAENDAADFADQSVTNNILSANAFLRPDGSPFNRPDGSIFERPA